MDWFVRTVCFSNSEVMWVRMEEASSSRAMAVASRRWRASSPGVLERPKPVR